MQKERLFIYDTTLRDGQQTQGVQFSLNEKLSVIRSLDDLGVGLDLNRRIGCFCSSPEFLIHTKKRLIAI